MIPGLMRFTWFLADLDARPWDFQAEECALRAAVDRFNNRRYGEPFKVAFYDPYLPLLYPW